MDQLSYIEKFYEKKEWHQILALRNIRPHHGIFLDEKEIGGIAFEKDDTGSLTEDGVRQLQEIREKFDTSGIDITLSILRILISFGYKQKLPGMGLGESVFKIEPVEELFMKAALKDFGWKQDLDLKMKRELMTKLFGNIRICDESGSPSRALDLSFVGIMGRLQNLFRVNPQFHFVDRLVWQKISNPDGSTSVKTDHLSKDEYMMRNSMNFKDLIPIPESISRIFAINKNDPRQTFSNKSRFLMIQYHVTRGDTDISKLRRLDIQAPIANYETSNAGKIQVTKLGVCQSTYLLSAVIKVTPREKEQIRRYWKNGTEMVPDQVGEFKKKFPCQGFGDHNVPWSIKDKGVYILFYYREHVPPGQGSSGNESEMNLDAPEISQ